MKHSDKYKSLRETIKTNISKLDNSWIKDFNSLSSLYKDNLLDLVIDSQFNLDKYTKDKQDIKIVNLGTFKIKKTRLIALDTKEDIAHDLGYENYDSIPNDELDKAKRQVETEKRIRFKERTKLINCMKHCTDEVRTIKLVGVSKFNNKK